MRERNTGGDSGSRDGSAPRTGRFRESVRLRGIPGAAGVRPAEYDPAWQGALLDEEALSDMKEKLFDADYVDGAISCIAHFLSGQFSQGRNDGRRPTG